MSLWGVDTVGYWLEGSSAEVDSFAEKKDSSVEADSSVLVGIVAARRTYCAALQHEVAQGSRVAKYLA